jgi:signal peptidase I
MRFNTFSLKGLLALLGFLVLLAVAARYIVVRPYEVAGSAMLDTLQDGQIVFANAWAYAFASPQRGDVVVFRSSDGRKELKRIIGVPGDTVVIRDGFVHLRRGAVDTKLEEPYLNAENRTKTFKFPPGGGDASEAVFVVPAEGYFILGDNRVGSLDSRSYESMDLSPYIPADALAGKVWSY